MNSKITSRIILCQFKTAVNILRIRINYPLHCSFYITEGLILVNVIRNDDNSILEFSVFHIWRFSSIEKIVLKPKGFMKTFFEVKIIRAVTSYINFYINLPFCFWLLVYAVILYMCKYVDIEI